MDKANHTDIPLRFPIDREGQPGIDKLRLSRPKTGHIIELVKLFGQEVTMALLAGDGEKLADRLEAVRGDEDAMAAHIAALLAPGKIDGLFAIMSGLVNLEEADARKIDPADYPAIGGAFLDFFPALKTLAEKVSTD